MPEEDTSTIPPSVLRVFYLAIFIIGLIILVTWEAIYLIPDGKFYDAGLFTVVLLLIGFGGVGYFMYGKIEKEEAEEED